MKLEEFYEADERRRESTEFEFGNGWTDKDGHSFELSWVETTGELYLMASPDAAVTGDLIFGDALYYDEPVNALDVTVIATIPTHSEVEDRLKGWAAAMGAPNSIAWLAERVPPAR